MIAVIADDFTGAAEIGGVGIRHGFKVVIETKVDKHIEADILIIATDTRSQTPEKAVVVTEKITSELLALQPDFIYKKIDSILRGNVGAELMAQLRASARERALLIPANPELQRTIKDGVYYYNGIPLNEFSFTSGSVQNRTSSHVLDLLGEEVRPLTTVLSTDDILPEKGLMIGNTSNMDDLENWVKKLDSQTIPAGGSSFFDTILRVRKTPGTYRQIPLQLGKKIMYVCGSAFINSRLLVQKAKQAGQAVAYMPEDLFCGGEPDQVLLSQWQNEICEGLRQMGKVIVAVDQISCGEGENLPRKIRETVAAMVETVMNETEIDELIIEGGATAYSVIQKLGYSRFTPVNELGPGSIRMKVSENENIFLTLKPGSYTWPDTIWPY